MRHFSITGRISITMISLMLLVTLIYLFSNAKNHHIISGDSFEAPSTQHLLGTDDLGIDIFSQLIFGIGESMQTGFVVSLLAGFGGCILGICAGYFGGRIDRYLMTLADIKSALPTLLLLLVFGAFFPFNKMMLICLLSFLLWVGPTRVARAKMLSLQKSLYIQVSRSYGASFIYLMKKHILRELSPLLAMQMVRTMSQAITMEASLAFIGVGDPTSKSLGAMIYRSTNYPSILYTDYWIWWVIPPTLVLIICILCFSFIGRDVEKIANKKRVTFT